VKVTGLYTFLYQPFHEQTNKQNYKSIDQNSLSCIQEARQFNLPGRIKSGFVKYYYYYYYYYSRAPFLMVKGITGSCKEAPVKEHSSLQAPVREREREREH
jgi:hypothetical protein